MNCELKALTLTSTANRSLCQASGPFPRRLGLSLDNRSLASDFALSPEMESYDYQSQGVFVLAPLIESRASAHDSVSRHFLNVSFI